MGISMLNDADILSDEDKAALKAHEQSVNEQIKILSKTLDELGHIMQWYNKQQELVVAQEKLGQDELLLSQKQLAALPIKQAMEQHLLALPFKEDLDLIERLKALLVKLDSDLKVHHQAQKTILDKLAQSKSELTLLDKAYQKAEQLQSDWMPKFDELARLDQELKTSQLLAVEKDL